LQLDTIKSLRSNQSIVIKPADKGSQIVIMDRVQYLLEANRQLNNVKNDVPLDHSIPSETQEMIKRILMELLEKKCITSKQYTYLLGPEVPRPRQFYLLPKMHKPLEEWSVPFQIPSARPIVSDCGSESYRIAEYIDYFIHPLSQKHAKDSGKEHASYVKDTYDFVDKDKGLELPLGAFLFSIDINSLYTNTETSLGLRAIKQAFDRFPDPQRPDKEILDLLELSLLRNDFNFNDEFYLQIHGTAMGKKCLSAFANLYMCFWEETAFLKCQILPFLYLRYLDDIFGIWVSSMQDFECFLETLNTHHSAITTSHNIQREKLEFLDTQVLFVPSDGLTKSLATKVFFKETDRHALLHKASYHPKHRYY
ncbi:unnamed protein product, partial [Oncorhynchus mykiss]